MHVTGTALWAVIVSGTDVVTSIEDSELLGGSRALIPGDSYCVGHAEKGSDGKDTEQIHSVETDVLDWLLIVFQCLAMREYCEKL